mgnify:CR=1 FL=1
MKLSKKAYYGLRATLTLVHRKVPASIRTLAKEEALPEDYLEKILQILRRANIVRAAKGADGGYTLTKKPHTITAWDIVRVLDGPIRITTLPKGVLPCSKVSHCQTNEVFRKLEQEIKRSLSKITLAALTADNSRIKR